MKIIIKRAKMINNHNKMRFNNRICLVVIALTVLILIFVSSVSAADPGHGAAVIGSGTFESGNFVFPNNLTINRNLLVGGNNFFVNNATGYVGIGTTSPGYKLVVSDTIHSSKALAP